MPRFNLVCLIVIIVSAIILISSALVCALCQNITVKIISGVIIGLSALVLIIFACIVQIFH